MNNSKKNFPITCTLYLCKFGKSEMIFSIKGESEINYLSQQTRVTLRTSNPKQHLRWDLEPPINIGAIDTC